MNIQYPLAALAATALILPSALPEERNRERSSDKNIRPICKIANIGTVPCQGDMTTVLLDGSGSFDVDSKELFFLWSACPLATIDDPTAEVTTMTINTSGSCDLTCGVRLEVTDGDKISYCRTFIRVTPDTAPDVVPHLDIKPGSCPNPINVAHGAPMGAKVAVSLLGNNIDVTQVNISTVRLQRASGGNSIAPIQNNISDTGTPFMGEGDCGCHALGGDGIDDLDLKFYRSDIINAFNLASEQTNTYVELELIGELLDGTPFAASDCMRILNNG